MPIFFLVHLNHANFFFRLMLVSRTVRRESLSTRKDGETCVSNATPFLHRAQSRLRKTTSLGARRRADQILPTDSLEA